MPLGCMVGWFRGRRSGQPAKQREAQLGETAKKQDQEGGRTAGWDLSLLLWGRTHCQLSTHTAGPVLWVGCARKGSVSEVPSAGSWSQAALTGKLSYRCF
ncbi:hypothetical protein U0070_007080 [Myodes glareolus]|uniref:Uncharacterized protein n=1 Tax=Myodes glareolus TaxID=447135 RepID=A0AAW0HID0_MYOGA